MKNLIKIYTLIILSLVTLSCSDKDTTNDIMYNKDNNSGGILRTISINGKIATTSVTRGNLAVGDDTSKFTLVVEAMDNENGGNLSRIEAWVAYKNNKVTPPATVSPAETPQVFLKSFQAGDLQRNAIGLPELTFVTTLGEIKTKLNAGGYTTGDVFYVYLRYVAKNGTVYSSANTSATVQGGSYNRSPFRYNLPIVCAITDASLFNGNYKVVVDQWEDYSAGATVPVLYSAANGAYKFRILSTNNSFISNQTTSYLEVTVDPISFDATVKSNETFIYPGFGNFNVTGTGNVGTCFGEINLKLNFSGSAQGQTFDLIKL